MGRLVTAFKAFFRILFNPGFAALVKSLMDAQPVPQDKPPAGPTATALLAILQREGRLVDFLMEPIDGVPDPRIGAIARGVHAGCRKALAEYFKVLPVLTDAEGSKVTVDPGFDPSAIRLVGNVTGSPPFKGSLKHHGWRVAEASLPTPAGKHDPSVIMPAEVEI